MPGISAVSAYECAACLTATLCHASHDCLNHCGMILANSHVVEENQRLGTLCEHVVDAHCHGVDADGVVLVEGECQFKFCADTVGAAHEDGGACS